MPATGTFPRALLLALIFSGTLFSGTPLSGTRQLAAAHPISVSEADVYVSRTKVTFQLSIFAEDLYLFQDIEPNEQDILSVASLDQARQQHRAFLEQRLELRNAAGNLIRGKVVEVSPLELPAQGVPVGDLMTYSLWYRLEYPLETPPEFLTFTQQIADDNFLFPSEMKLRVKQAGDETPFLAMLRAGNPHTIRLDWSRPPMSAEATDQEWEQWFQRQKKETLGITSYSSIYSFVYLTPREVRHEILIPLASLATMVPLERADPNFLEIGEQEAAAQVITDFLAAGNPLTIDGQAIEPRFDRVDFYGLDLRDFARRAAKRKVSMANGRVGVIISYPPPATPYTDVRVTWDIFNANLRTVESIVFAFDKTLKTTFSSFQENNTFEWKREAAASDAPAGGTEISLAPSVRSYRLHLPSVIIAVTGCGGVLLWLGYRRGGSGTAKWVPACLLAGGSLAASAACWPWTVELADPWQRPGPLTAEQSQEVFTALHENIYRAFEAGGEEAVYDSLATSVDGQLLHDLYLKIRRGLEMQEQGGAVARLEEVAHLAGSRVDAPELSQPNFRYRSSWNVRGTVEHWGHIHERTNQYEAEFTVELSPESVWKITDMNVLDEQRVGMKTRLRDF